MGKERYAEIADAIYAAFGSGDEEAMARHFAPDFTDHSELPPGIPRDVEGVKAWTRMMRAGFPDIRFERLDMVAEDGKAACRLRMTGTNTGDMPGMPATGRSMDVEAFDLVTLNAEDKVTGHWGAFEEGKMMRQLGMIPEQSAAQVDAERPTGV